MKFIVNILICLLFLPIGCTKSESHELENFIPVMDISKYHMKLLPESAISTDIVKLVVFDDCQYNLLTGVARSGNIIEITKQFNSMMKLPCMLRNDTIPIGKLPSGSYTINYKLVDVATSSKQQIVFAISFPLTVSK